MAWLPCSQQSQRPFSGARWHYAAPCSHTCHQHRPQEVQPPQPEAPTNAEALIDSPVELERFFLMQSNSVRRSMFGTD